MKYFGFDDVSKDKKLYNRIIYQRSICKMLFNDYRKDELDKIFGTEQSTLQAFGSGKAEPLIYKSDDIV